MIYITYKMLIEKLKTATPVYGWKKGSKKELVIIYDEYKKKKESEIQNLKNVRYINLETLQKVKSFLNKNFVINVIGL